MSVSDMFDFSTGQMPSHVWLSLRHGLFPTLHNYDGNTLNSSLKGSPDKFLLLS